MKSVQKLLAVLPLGIALLVPCGMLAEDHDHDRDRDRDHRGQYYDPDHRDYHRWDSREDRAWHRYWEQQRRERMEYNRANEEQRRAYWRWRHEHRDDDDYR